MRPLAPKQWEETGAPTVCLLKNELTTTHWLREPIGAVVKASLHRAIVNVYGPEPG